jgi:hypothetical protein
MNMRRPDVDGERFPTPECGVLANGPINALSHGIVEDRRRVFEASCFVFNATSVRDDERVTDAVGVTINRATLIPVKPLGVARPCDEIREGAGHETASLSFA